MNRTYLLRQIALLSAAACLLLLAGCSTSSREAQLAIEAGDSGLIAGTPPFPSEQNMESNPRQVSVDLSVQLNGVDFMETNALADGILSLQMVPNQGGVGPFVWAVYQAGPLGPNFSASAISVSLSEMEAGGEYYFAFADFTGGVWDVHPFTPGGAFEELGILGDFDPARHVSPQGNVFIALLTYSLNLTVDSLSLSGMHTLAAPQNMVATDYLSPDYIFLWADLVPGATGYEVFYKEAGQPDDFYGFLGQAGENEGKVFFEHTKNTPAGKTAVFGVEYEYKIRATADGEDPSPFSEPDTGIRGFPTPHQVIATDQVFEDKVFVVWFSDTQNGLPEYRYRIIRDDVVVSEVVFGNQTGGGSWEDTTLTDFNEHIYQVYQVGPEGQGGVSPPDGGCRASYFQTTLMEMETGTPAYADMEVSPANTAEPAISAVVYSSSELVYGHGTQASFTPVTQADARETTQLAIYNGLPWIAFGNHDPAYGPVGVRIARGKIADPTTEEHWDVYTILECDISSDELAMEVIGGRLAVAFADKLADEYILRYAYANTDDPQIDSDWEIFKLGSYDWQDRPLYVDIAERQGVPLVAAQLVTPAIELWEADSAQPGDQGSWTTYPVNIGSPVSGPSALDLLVHNDVAYIPFIESGYESNGRVMLVYSTQWPPVGDFAWFPSYITDVTDERCEGISVAFIHRQPWISYSHTGEGGPVIASHLYDEDFNDGSWGAGLWFIDTVDEDPTFQESRNETTLLEIDGQPSLLYEMRNVGSGYTLRYARLNGKDELPN